MVYVEIIKEVVLDVGNFINTFLSFPSKLIPFLSVNLILIGVSVLFGWFLGTKAVLGFKTIFVISLSILFYCTMRFIGVG